MLNPSGSLKYSFNFVLFETSQLHSISRKIFQNSFLQNGSTEKYGPNSVEIDQRYKIFFLFGQSIWNNVSRSKCTSLCGRGKLFILNYIIWYKNNDNNIIIYPTNQPSFHPSIEHKMFPVFVFLSIIENIIRYFSGKNILRLNDSIASISSGLVQDCFR